jgi:hypothetical protein
MVTPNGRVPEWAFHENPYRECGTRLHIAISPAPKEGPERRMGYASSMTISLSDQRAVFFDNGVAAYMETQVQRVSSEQVVRPGTCVKNG